MSKHIFMAAIATAWFGAQAGATPVTALGDFTPTAPVVTFEDVADGTTGPLTFGPLTVSSSPNQTVGTRGYTQYAGIYEGKSYGFGVVTFYLDFAVDMAAVGLGLFDPNYANTRVMAYDRSGTLIETVYPDKGPTGGVFSTYTGVMRAEGDIARLVVTPQAGDLLAIDNIGWATAAPAVPLPSAALLLLGGFGALGALRRR
ncbi:hypothetical protein RGUI_1788 [Rhodovulum sp. P5]|uniref:VPLPA-CTERM sorting domain-containing protein n=1 Tax=Rhodovulum sp. P5 TaxID=1564506 RepID=UPI0009C24B26|nr:VPLPA-CTERM sorting domain-containing protein [Rhodovulum sp. P5]ARE39929.1 hypothetical protein RGUI_1788 [Rhodovulum sp. P5]